MGDLHPLDQQENGGPPPTSLPAQETLIPSATSKRQRRPSVRLGEIGDQPIASPSHDPSSRRPKLSKLLPTSSPLIGSKPSTKPRVTAPMSARRARTNWNSRIDNEFDPDAADLKSSGGDEARNDEYVEDSESPCHRNDHRASIRVRVSNEGEEISEEGFKGWTGGIRSFLEGLGLGQYTPVFEIHEVDDGVLPMLTMEDLRDMGINAVGSRRKIYCAIQKLNRSGDS
ncbi:protein bicaudal C homolog 1-B-like [Phalaenopsis equestris]|uniref:protein bicaudal C homolog 1-B-like n=1 Tax=Phalaenopsis equestris TaxID=78828 RepID=UPI0009E2B529|nr:protein bicaudal C homolog 1-B-like [Phalaenopsis equestris]